MTGRQSSGYYYDDIYQLTQRELLQKMSEYAYSYVNSEQKTGFAMVYNRDGENTVTSKLIKLLKVLIPTILHKVTFRRQLDRIYPHR